MTRRSPCNRLTRRPLFEQLEGRHLLCAEEFAFPEEAPLWADGEAAVINYWHNASHPEDVNDDGHVSPLDLMLIVNDLHARGSRFLPDVAGGNVSAVGSSKSAENGTTPYLDVNDDLHVSALDALIVINALIAQSQVPSSTLPAPSDPGIFQVLDVEAEGTPPVVLTASEVETLLQRAAAASASEDFIIAIVDRGGRILGVRVEAGVLAAYGVGTPGERTADLVFAIDGAVAKARTGAFFSNNTAPLTSRTVRFISQSTITQREVESNPNIPDLASTKRGPGFVAPIGLGGQFPPNVAHTPPVDLFAIEHTNRDSLLHAGVDAVIGTADDITLSARFDAPFEPGMSVEAPESYGVVSGRLPTARSRGIATLPGGLPLFKANPATGALTLVGGIGVFYPGPDGYATHEQGFVPQVGQTSVQRTNAPRVLEAEWIAFAAACGSSGARASVGPLDGVPCPKGFDLPFGRIDLVGITLEIYGPNPTASNPRSGVATLLAVGNAVRRGSRNSGADQIVAPGGVLRRAGEAVPEGWLVGPRSSPTGEISAAQVRTIIEQAIRDANQVRAAIRLPIGSRTRMVFSVTDLSGNVLGLYRMPDATVFSIDVAVAKARNTAYYANPAELVPADRVDDNRDGVPDPSVPAGAAFTNRTFRFLAEPRYPAGVVGSRPGAFSSLLDPGINRATAENLGPALPASVYSTNSTSVLMFDSFNPARNFRDPSHLALQNGVVFFPGSAPLYNSAGKLIGGFGASGDGVDQDDVVTASAVVGFQTPAALRADQYFVRGVRLPYQKFNRNPRA